MWLGPKRPWGCYSYPLFIGVSIESVSSGHDGQKNKDIRSNLERSCGLATIMTLVKTRDRMEHFLEDVDKYILAKFYFQSLIKINRKEIIIVAFRVQQE